MGDKEVQGCARKCVATCIRGGGGKLHCQSLSKNPEREQGYAWLAHSMFWQPSHYSSCFSRLVVSLHMSAAARNSRTRAMSLCHNCISLVQFMPISCRPMLAHSLYGSVCLCSTTHSLHGSDTSMAACFLQKHVSASAGAPGLGPLSQRRELVVFKEGYRSRQYCLSECIQVCAAALKKN